MSVEYTLRATDLGSPDDFVFRFNGRDVGRTYAMALRTGSIYGINLRGPLPSGVEVQCFCRRSQGSESERGAFKVNWERLLAAGSVKP